MSAGIRAAVRTAVPYLLESGPPCDQTNYSSGEEHFGNLVVMVVERRFRHPRHVVSATEPGLAR